MFSPYVSAIGLPSQTAVADTPFAALIPPVADAIAKVTALQYTSGGTAHALKLMKALGVSTASAAMVATDTVLNVVAKAFHPGQTVAANDYLAVRLASGSWHLSMVASVSDLALTLTTAVPEAVNEGAQVWYFGAAGDTGHHGLTPTVSVRTDYLAQYPGHIANSGFDFASAGVRYRSEGRGRPIMFYSPNGTAAGTLQTLSAVYSTQP